MTSRPLSATASTPQPGVEAVVGLHLPARDGRPRSERDVEHHLLAVGTTLAALGVPVTTLSTHRTVVGDEVACTGAVAAGVDRDLLAGYLTVACRELGLPGPEHGGTDDAAAHADAAAAARAGRREGRAVRFPGGDAVGERTTVAALLRTTAVTRVAVLGGGTAHDDDVVVTRSFLRPRWNDGELTLLVQPAVGGTLVPFETPTPTPCCVDHA